MVSDVVGRRMPERMSRRRLHWIGCGLAIAAPAMTVLAAPAEAPPPPQEFWNYLLEFGDARGDVFDPADLAIATQVQPKTAKASKATERGQPNTTIPVEPSAVSPATAPVVPGEKSE